MKEMKKSAAGRLFYTFGTVLLMAVVTICVMNYAKDGRAFQMPVLSAVTGTQPIHSTAGAIKSSEDYKTIKYQKPVTKAPAKSTSSQSGKSAGKSAPPPAPNEKPPVVDP